MKTRKRTLAREIALQLLYQYDIRRKVEGDDLDLDAEGFISRSTKDPEVRDFARVLCCGVLDFLETADRLICEVVDNWRPERIATMDRAILRLAVFELSELMDVPPKVAINEAIELAKRYSTAQSGAFVNGVLDRLMVLRSASSTPPPEAETP
jgi:N utilization substance protein B